MHKFKKWTTTRSTFAIADVHLQDTTILHTQLQWCSERMNGTRDREKLRGSVRERRALLLAVTHRAICTLSFQFAQIYVDTIRFTCDCITIWIRFICECNRKKKQTLSFGVFNTKKESVAHSHAVEPLTYAHTHAHMQSMNAFCVSAPSGHTAHSASNSSLFCRCASDCSVYAYFRVYTLF